MCWFPRAALRLHDDLSSQKRLSRSDARISLMRVRHEPCGLKLACAVEEFFSRSTGSEFDFPGKGSRVDSFRRQCPGQ